MKKTAIALAGLICLSHATPTWAAPRKNKPWFSNKVNRETVLERSITPSRTKPSKNSRVIEDRPLGRQVAKQALSYKGTRYKMGGTTKKGLDCSGLVARVWSDLKMKRVPRVSAALYQSGQPVKTSELRPGDLVFFKNTYKRGISHVGVYTGNNKFVHAANRRKGVTITRLSDPYYQLHYAGARRLY